MVYAPKIARLRTMTDEELEELYDRLAENTAVGTGFVLEELRRRDTDRGAASSRRIAVAAFVLSAVVGAGSLTLGGIQLWIATHPAVPPSSVERVVRPAPAPLPAPPSVVPAPAAPAPG